jgi:hypothetical protein
MDAREDFLDRMSSPDTEGPILERKDLDAGFVGTALFDQIIWISMLHAILKE